jgi:hypothetical protein
MRTFGPQLARPIPAALYGSLPALSPSNGTQSTQKKKAAGTAAL